MIGPVVLGPVVRQGAPWVDDAVGSSRIGIVSCDIVDYSSRLVEVQFERIQCINTIIGRAIKDLGPERAVWVPSGDGGHVIFRGSHWQELALQLIRELRDWANQPQQVGGPVLLRVTAHVGSVRFLIGADGREQAVGDGISLASWLLTRGPKNGILASAAFEQETKMTLGSREITFEHHRILRDEWGCDQHVALMSTPSDRSSWDPPAEASAEAPLLMNDGDRKPPGGAGWEIIYDAKRRLQVNDQDGRAINAIESLKRADLRYRRKGVRGQSNPFLDRLNDSQIHEVIMLGDLVERRYNEYVCQFNDTGDTMFVILRGQVGIFLPPQEEGPSAWARPHFVHEEGEIVGELAFAMSRRRTADVVALTDTSLLAFNHNEMAKRLPVDVMKDVMKNVRDFMRSRALEHVSQRVPFLAGPDHQGPLTLDRHGQRNRTREDVWQRALGRIESCSTLIHVPRTGSTELSFATMHDVIPDATDGIYVLVGGALRGRAMPPSSRVSPQVTSSLQPRTLAGETYPLLWVNLPGIIVLPPREFHIESEPITILRLGRTGLVDLHVWQRKALYHELRRAAATCFEYDAFISYNSGDAQVADRWANALTDAKLSVFRDIPRPGEEFLPRLWAALRQSRALVPLVSPHVMVRKASENWVLREINAHQHYFDERRIYPVVFPGGRHEHILSGYSPIRVTGDESRSIRELITELKALRDGAVYPPFSMSQKVDFR